MPAARRTTCALLLSRKEQIIPGIIHICRDARSGGVRRGHPAMRRRISLAAVSITLAVTFAACERTGLPTRVAVPPDSAASEVEFHLAPHGAAILVSAFINGRGPIDLILDTGATLTCLDDSLTRQLDLPARRGAVGVGAGVGLSGPLRLLRVDSVRVGSAVATNLTVCSLDLRSLQHVSPGARGLLGLNFLKSFRVNIDFNRRVLQLSAP
jgi:predicted aspartyl protease